MITKNSSFQKKRASGEVQLEGGVGAIRTKVQQLQLARLGCPPSACLPAAGPEAPRMRNGKLEMARVRRRRPGGYGAGAVRTLQDTAHMS